VGSILWPRPAMAQPIPTQRIGQQNERMAYSIRAREVVARMAAERARDLAAARLAAEALEARHHATYLDRHRAAAYLGMSVHRLKRMMTAGTAPACIKRGTSQQAKVVWDIAELDLWKADPRAYLAERAAEESATTPEPGPL